jgi:hypothetical protein
VDFYRRYINICRDHIDTVCRRVLRDLDEEFEVEKQLYLNDADAMNEIQSIRSTYVKEIQQTFSKAMRYIPAAYPDREAMEMSREIFKFCQPRDPYTRPLLTSALATFQSASGWDFAWNPYLMETDVIQRSKTSVVEILRSNYAVRGVDVRRIRHMATVSSYMILVNHYLNDYEKITSAEFEKLYHGDQSLNTQLEKDDSVDRYAAFSQKHPKSIIDIGESLMMLTNIIRVAAVTSLDNIHMRPSPASMRLFRSNNDLLLPLIEFLSKTGQFTHALHLLDTSPTLLTTLNT